MSGQMAWILSGIIGGVFENELAVILVIWLFDLRLLGCLGMMDGGFAIKADFGNC